MLKGKVVYILYMWGRTPADTYTGVPPTYACVCACRRKHMRTRVYDQKVHAHTNT